MSYFDNSSTNQQQQQQHQPQPVDQAEAGALQPPPVSASNSSRYLAAGGAGGGGSGESRMVPPAYYPMKSLREMWPHQMLERHATEGLKEDEALPVATTTTMTTTTSRLQVDDQVAADFDSVNAATMRANYAKDIGAATTSKTPIMVMVDEDDSEFEEKSEAAAAAGPSPQTGAAVVEPNPDVLRGQFIEMSDNKNSLAMFWEQTIERYRSGWRDYVSGRFAAVSEQPKNRPMVVDLFSEGLWQKKWRRTTSVPPLSPAL
ncbi:hypothetical protein GGI21_006239 [Coemansia aciculifera]|nr:hypothetical protein GGI21_006239 [Coemansia aciculifera]